MLGTGRLGAGGTDTMLGALRAMGGALGMLGAVEAFGTLGIGGTDTTLGARRAMGGALGMLGAVEALGTRTGTCAAPGMPGT